MLGIYGKGNQQRRKEDNLKEEAYSRILLSIPRVQKQ